MLKNCFIPQLNMQTRDSDLKRDKLDFLFNKVKVLSPYLEAEYLTQRTKADHEEQNSYP